MNKVLFSSKRMDWETPQKLFDMMDAQFHFALDAAANEYNAKCSRYFAPEQDGLSQSWEVGGAVFCNPHYGRETGKWVKKAWQEAQKGVTIVMLIPARTDTSYFHDWIYDKADVVFLRGRLRFELGGVPQGRAPFPAMLVIYNGDLSGSKRMIMEILSAKGDWERVGNTDANR